MKPKQDWIIVRGASEHNLKNVDVQIPQLQFSVLSGVSGSGKSSLAFDTIFQEGQRRFIESLSPYARQFLGVHERPHVESLEGLSPTICVDQKTVNRNPRSTVGTITELYDHYRLLFSRLGKPYCPQCQEPIQGQTPDQITDQVFADGAGQKCMLLAPMVQERKGEYRKELDQWRTDGFVRARIDGTIRRLDEEIVLERYEMHSIDLVIDRLRLTPDEKSRFTEGVERSLNLSKGLVIALYGEQEHLFSSLMACPRCQIAIPEMEPRLFSFNSPQGACPECQGLGELYELDESKLFDEAKPLLDGGMRFLNPQGKILYTAIGTEHFQLLFKLLKLKPKTSWADLSDEAKQIFLHGNASIGLNSFRVFHGGRQLKKFLTKGEWIGIEPIFKFVAKFVKRIIEQFGHHIICESCQGARLNPIALAVQFHQHHIQSLISLSVSKSYQFFKNLKLSEFEKLVGHTIFQEIILRLKFLDEVGVGYLTLERSAATLSGGEAQRIRLATHIGSGLQGVLYVLDEPSIGLHPSDNQRLIGALKTLRDRGNTVLVVEHDEETILSADYVVDVGVGAGQQGGEIVVSGRLKALFQSQKSLTGKFLSGKETIPFPEQRRLIQSGILKIQGASLNNLNNVDFQIPLGVFVGVAGVSGSGKSTLLDGVLKPALSEHVSRKKVDKPPYQKVEGFESIKRVVEINQAPIGRTPRSNPATYVKAFDEIRSLFAKLPESRARGYTVGRFSFNVKGGRCEECQGAGVKTIEMQFFSNVQVVCETCHGRRFNAQTLEILYRGKTIEDVLNMSVDEAYDFFKVSPTLERILGAMCQVGLGYVKLGQPSTTLSGGEAQRVKLASEFRKLSTKPTFYLLDEPTTGLHSYDVRLLLQLLQKLVELGHSVLIVEHHLDVLKSVDYLIEMGPSGGDDGGQVVAQGTPEEIAEHQQSLTGRFLKQALHQTYQIPKEAVHIPKVKNQDLVIRGAFKNNLKHVDLTIPHGKITVFTGVSGSGKSTLAIGTIFSEGQARYVESLSTYARRFLGKAEKAQAKSIEGLAPAIAITQKSASRNPRSNVATSTEIYDHLRLLYARIGQAYCPHCQRFKKAQLLEQHSPSRAAKVLLQKASEQRMVIAAPLYLPHQFSRCVLQKPEQLLSLQSHLQEQGFVRIYMNQQNLRLDEELPQNLNALGKQGIWLVIDRLVPNAKESSRLTEAFEMAYQQGNQLAQVWLDEAKQQLNFSERYVCPTCYYTQHEPLNPRLFSFNAHVGACPACEGLGTIHKSQIVCPQCQGQRLKPEYLAVKIGNQNIIEFCEASVTEALAKVKNWKLTENEAQIAEQPLQEIRGRLLFLEQMGVGYLKLNQPSATLSGGESQRIRLASQIGAGLTGALYVLDEPTIGLHPKDSEQLFEALTHLRDLGNTLIIVEHDLEMIRLADHLVDFGLGAGQYGGEIIAQGTPKQVMKNAKSLTGKYLKNKLKIEIPKVRRSWQDAPKLTIQNATEHNLKNISVSFPIGAITTVTGVSGAGKSTLVFDVLAKAVQKNLETSKKKTSKSRQKIQGMEHVSKLLIVNQDPIGHTPRSTPLTYIKGLPLVAELFASLPDAKERGFSKSRFSFNSIAGRCPACEGLGVQNIEMHFLSDVIVECSACQGMRYNRETLAVSYRGYTIADILKLEIQQALEVFDKQPKLKRLFQTLHDVGLGYLKLGQPGNTLSGGEAQRLKLAVELSKRTCGRSLYLFDEPTTGLHIDDVARLVLILHQLADQGHTVILVEHHLDMMKISDYMIDLGPQGGEFGGEVIASGSPEELLQTNTQTALHLKKVLF